MIYIFQTACQHFTRAAVALVLREELDEVCMTMAHESKVMELSLVSVYTVHITQINLTNLFTST